MHDNGKRADKEAADLRYVGATGDKNTVLEDIVMATSQHGYWLIREYRRFSGTFTFLAVGMLMLGVPGVSSAKEDVQHHHNMSANYILNIDPSSGGMVGKALAKEVGEFFDDAEAAIEARDINRLMALYSDAYTNGMHKKADIAATWRVIFTEFNSLAMTHNMRFITTDPKSNVIIMRCSGILIGVPSAERGSIAVDSWMNTDHVLVREGGKLKIIGSAGAEQKRLWFDKPLHPLF